MAHLPHIDMPATRDDVRALGQRIDHVQESMDQRFQSVDQRFQSMHERFTQLEEAMDLRFELLFERMADRDQMVDQRFSEVHTEIRAAQAEILATVRGDIVTQTRAMFFTMAGSVAALGGLALGLARLV